MGISIENQPAANPSRWIVAGIDYRNLLWVFLALGVMGVAIVWDDEWLLRYVHIVSGVLLTGADILFGFIIGPVVRRLDFEARRAFSLTILPKTLFVMQTLGIMAPTSGWFLAVHYGYLELAYPQFWWVLAALIVSGFLAIGGLGLILPSNIRAYIEFRKPNPDPERLKRIMSIYFGTIATQGVMQVLIMVIMVKFATGL